MDEKPKILIVEDERIIALETQHKLESMGYDVSAIVSSGEEAIRKAEELSPDLILMDIILQGEMDGVEAADKIHARFDIPVVYVTANVSDARLEDITRTEPFGCLFKPFEDIELRAAIDMALHRYKMEKRLRESEQKYRSLASTADSMYLVDSDCRFLFMNEQYRARLGMKLREVIGKTYGEVHSAEGAKKFAKKVETIFKTGKSIQHENRSHRDGKYHIRTLSPVKDSDGKTTAVTVVSKDITDHRQTEDALRESEERFRTIFESSEEGYYEIDLAGRFTFFNETMRKISGHSAGELMGMSNLEYTTPETAKKMYKLFSEIHKTGNPGEIGRYEGTAKDGTKITLGLSAYLMRDEKGEPVGFRGIVRDTTVRKRAEEELKESEERFRSIFSNIPNIAVQGYDKDRKVTFWNKASEKIYGYSRDEAMNKQLEELIIPPEMKETVISWINNWHENNVHIPSGELVLMKKDKSPVQVYSSHVMIENTNGRKEMFCIDIDITDRKKVEGQIKQSLREEETLLAEIHHRVKNNMQIISSLLSLHSRDIDDERTISLIRNCEDRIRSMSLVHEKLYLSEDLSLIDFSDYVESLSARLFRTYRVDSRVVSYSSHIKDAFFNIETAIPLGLITNELISNAMRYAFPEGRKGNIAVELHFDRETEEYTLIVTDDGIGIPEEIDYKNPKTFGLQLVNMLTEQLNGTMGLDRSKGTSFRVTFKEREYRRRI